MTQIKDKEEHSKTKLLLQLIKEQNGTVTFQDAKKAGIHKEYVLKLFKDNGLEKVGPGSYVAIDQFPDEYYILQKRFKKGIYSHETALYLHDLTDVTPFDYHMTFPRGYNNPSLKENNILAKHSRKDTYLIGLMTMKSPHGNSIRVYDRERTICDIFSKSNLTDKDVQINALKRYLTTEEKDLIKLMQYAQLFKVDRDLRKYMEVLV